MESDLSTLDFILVKYSRHKLLVDQRYPPDIDRYMLIKSAGQKVNGDPILTHGAKIFESESSSVIVDLLELDDLRILNFIETMKGFEIKSNVAILSNQEKEILLNFIETLDSGQ